MVLKVAYNHYVLKSLRKEQIVLLILFIIVRYLNKMSYHCQAMMEKIVGKVDASTKTISCSNKYRKKSYSLGGGRGETELRF